MRQGNITYNIDHNDHSYSLAAIIGILFEIGVGGK